jgi:iron(III) transport system permease protein
LTGGSLAAAGLVVLPLLALAFVALAAPGSGVAVLASAAMGRTLADTGLLLAGVALGAGSIGFVSAWLVSAYSFPGRALLSALLVMPLALPTYVAAYVAVEMLDSLGPVQSALRALLGFKSRADYWFPEIRSLPGAIAVFSFVLYPYVYLPVRAVFALRSAELSEAARTLGAGPFAHFWRAVAPLARPALSAGLALALLETLNDLGAAEILGVQTFTVAIFDVWLNRGSLAGAAQIAILMLAVIAITLGFEAHARRDRRYAVSPRRPRLARGISISGLPAAAAVSACAVPVIFGFIAPLLFLMVEAYDARQAEGVSRDLGAQAAATALLAAAASALALALGFAAVLAARLAPLPRHVWAKRIARLGYALPGTVLALGFLMPLAGLDDLFSRLLRDHLGLAPRQFFIGTGVALVLALAARFTSVAIANLDAGLVRISLRVDEAARSLGASQARLSREILAPLLGPAFAAATILVFVDMVKELPATLLLRPLGVETLATALYGHASRGRFEEGAVQALLIVAISLLPVLRLALLTRSAGLTDSLRTDLETAGLGERTGL